MFSDLVTRVKKIGQPPGTAIYTGAEINKVPVVTALYFDEKNCVVRSGNVLDVCLADRPKTDVSWFDVEGLHDNELIKQIAEQFHIHPLTVEDILNIEQRPKVEEFDNYTYITLRLLKWDEKNTSVLQQQLSIIFGKDFILTFHERESRVIDMIKARIQNTTNQRLRQQKSDYLVYRIIDAAVDDYFSVLEEMGEKIENIEKKIISLPTKKSASVIYRLKRQMLMLRRVIWPLREILSHLLYEENELISRFTRVYVRDAYDHTVQAIDTVETFRDMISSLLDMYLSSLAIRTNEIMKTLTILWKLSTFGLKTMLLLILLSVHHM